MNFEEGKLFTSVEDGEYVSYVYTNGELVKYEQTEQLNITESDRDLLLRLFEFSEDLPFTVNEYDKLKEISKKLSRMFYNDDLLE